MIKSFFKTTALFLLFASGQALAQSGDLEIISVDPSPTGYPQNTASYVTIAVFNNGPDDLPIGSARVNVAIDVNFFNWIVPVTITDDCGNVWTLQTVSPTATTPAQIQLRNNGAPLGANVGCFITVPIIGIAQTASTAVNITSTVFGPGVSDPLGTNQTGSANLTITAPLPVTLTSFTVNKENTSSLLKWATTSETNSDYFEVQRSVNGKNWQPLGTVSSNGESTVLRQYTFTDSKALKGLNYYRLKMVDKDETYAYSRIRSVDFGQAGVERLVVFPNPVHDQILIQADDISQISEVEVIGVNGQVLYQQTRQNSDVNDKIDVKNFKSGIYVVRMTRSDSSVTSVKIIKE